MSDRERADLTAQILGAEQDERRRIALFLHDGPVQSLAGIALMLDATVHFIAEGRTDEASKVLEKALERHRMTIGELRELSFSLEPVVLRDHGFSMAARALMDQRGQEHGIHAELDVVAIEELGEQTQAALYEIVRESLEGAIRRGPPTRFVVTVTNAASGFEMTIADDAPGERRRRSLEALEERARTLGARFDVHQDDQGTTLTLALPPYALTE